MSLPVKNRPVVTLHLQELSPEQWASQIREKCQGQDTIPVLHIQGLSSPDYPCVKALAAAIAKGMEAPILVSTGTDMAKALGQAIALERPEDGVLCIDGVVLCQGDYLDVGNPVGPAFPVVVKTLVLEK